MRNVMPALAPDAWGRSITEAEIDAWGAAANGPFRFVLRTARPAAWIEVQSEQWLAEWRITTGHGPVARTEIVQTGPAGGRACLPCLGEHATIEVRPRAILADGAGTVNTRTGLYSGVTSPSPIGYAALVNRPPARIDSILKIDGDDTAAIPASSSITLFAPGYARSVDFLLVSNSGASSANGYVQVHLQTAGGPFTRIAHVPINGRRVVRLPAHPWYRYTLRNEDAGNTMTGAVLWRAEGV